MHEFSTMANIVGAVMEEGRKHNASRITKVLLEIGELTFLGEEQLRFAFGVLTKDTEMEGAELIIGKVKPKVRCQCGYEGDASYAEKEEFHIQFPILRCPECGDTVEIINGRECLIKNVEIEIEDVSPQG
ncbi:MAG: hydrogenase maturation nickel metallochaperone HypA [Candidatus Thermoplasmatota archaeon]|nr:hydrogenase maturation nickel metallochaperone HypA [Candidatus Thermoplasmatota archaeon]